MRQTMGIDPGALPTSGTYRGGEENTAITVLLKELKTPMAAAEAAPTVSNGVGAVDNRDDCLSNPVPLLPRDASCKILLLDIEGCTTAISFVRDVLFPFARQQLPGWAQSFDPNAHQAWLSGLRAEVAAAGGDPDACDPTIARLAFYLMGRDVNFKVLKEILEGRLRHGRMKGNVFPDFLPMLQWLSSTPTTSGDDENNNKVKVCIYSPGSVQAQKLLFGNSVAGDLLPYLSGHFDIPTAGPKKENASKIAAAVQVDPAEMVFVSDAGARIEAATAAGFGAAVMRILPGNAPPSEKDAAKFSDSSFAPAIVWCMMIHRQKE